MSGHSKWASIKHKKGAVDAAKGKLFSKLNKEITVAARDGGGDPESNSRLRLAIEKAKQNNMPNDNINRAVKRGTGEIGGAIYEQTTYEGYGPGGVAFFIEVTTDNKNRAAAEIRSIFTKNGGNLGSNGCVAYMFVKKGLIHFDKGTNEDKIMEIALDAGAEDVVSDATGIDVLTVPDELHDVMQAFEGRNLEWESADLTMIPSSSHKVTGKIAEQVLRMMDMFEDHDDVSHVYSNFDIEMAEMLAFNK